MPSTQTANATPPLYRRLATHYRGAIEAGSLRPGERMPSLRHLMRLHDISLSTALQLCRTLESDGWAEARDALRVFRAPAAAPAHDADGRAAGRPAPRSGAVRRHPCAGVGLRRAAARRRRQAQPLDRPRRAAVLSGRSAARRHDARAAAAPRAAGRRAAAAGRPELPRRARQARARGRHDAGARRGADHQRLHRGAQPRAARGRPARRHHRGGIAHLLRPAAGAGKPGPARAGDSHQPADRPVDRGARPRAADLQRHQGRGGGPAPAEPAGQRDARRAQAAPGAAVRAAAHRADRGRHLQRAARHGRRHRAARASNHGTRAAAAT